MFLIDTIILVSSLLVLFGILSRKFSARFGVPMLVLFLLVGMLGGSEGIGGIAFDDYGIAHAVGTLALAVILFDGGLRTPLASVRTAWKPALSMATIGVLITAAITAVAANLLLGLPLLEALLLGSIVASTDAAAVFSVLRSQGLTLEERVGSTLELERCEVGSLCERGHDARLMQLHYVLTTMTSQGAHGASSTTSSAILRPNPVLPSDAGAPSTTRS